MERYWKGTGGKVLERYWWKGTGRFFIIIIGMILVKMYNK